MKNRIISFSLAIAMLLSCFVFTKAFADTVNYESVATEANLLKTLGIIDEYKDEEAGNEEMTRAEFVKIAAKAMGIAACEETNYYFTDVPKDHEALSFINRFAEMNILSYPGSLEFRPESIITVNEAVKIALCMAGYGDFAMTLGGYPGGFLDLASRLDFRITGGNNALNVYDAYILIYDTLRIPLFEKSAAGLGFINYEEGDETLLSRYFDVFEAEGVITQSSGVSLDGEALTGKTGVDTRKIVVINDTVYSSELSFFGRLGKNTGVFYRLENEDDTPDIIGTFNVRDRSEVTDVRLKDFVSYNNRIITYYDGNKQETAEIPSGAVIIKNGTVERYNENEAFWALGTSGYIRLIDTEDDNRIDYVLIWRYENVYVESIAGDNLVISDGLGLRNEAKPLMLADEAAEKIVVVENSDGTYTDATKVTKGKLISVYESEEYLRVIINSVSLSGTVDEVSLSDGIMKVKVTMVGGISTVYEMNEDYYNIVYSPEGQDKALEPGAKVTVFLDAEGRISYIIGGMSNTWEYVYLVKLLNDEDYDRSLFKVFTSAGYMDVLKPAEKIVVDGKRTERSFDAIMAALEKESVESGEHKVNGQVLRVKTNINGDIVEIDSSKKGESEDAYSLSLAGSHSNTVWRTYSRAFAVSGSTLFATEDAVHFCVPPYSELETADSDEFFLGNSNIYAGNYLTITSSVKAYKTNPDSLNCDAFEVNIKSNTGSNPYKYNRGIVLSKIKMIRNEGVIEERLELASLTTGSVSYWYAEAEDNKFASIDVGDVATIRTNNRSKLVDAYVEYDYSEETVVGTGLTSDAPHNPANTISYYYGTLYERDGDLLKINLDPADYDGKYAEPEYDFAIRFRNGRVPVIVYEKGNVTVEDLAILAPESQFAESERPNQKYVIVTQNMLMKSIVYFK